MQISRGKQKRVMKARTLNVTNREKLFSMTDEELSDFLCETMENIQNKTKEDDWCCDICPASKYCKKGKNGFLAWLRKRAERV
jgi:hypothetical protein